MRIKARINIPEGMKGPDTWDENWGLNTPLNHVICHDVDGTPHMVGEFVWPWTAYTAHQNTFLLNFFYWRGRQVGRLTVSNEDITREREARIRELQLLMVLQIYYGADIGPRTLERKLAVLRYVARFAETRSCAVRDVLTQADLLDACGGSVPDHSLDQWMSWLEFLRQLDRETQLGFALATPKRWKDLERRVREYLDSARQYVPLPTRTYAALINNLSAELDDIEEHKPKLLAALREAVTAHRQVKAKTPHKVSIGRALIQKHDLVSYFEKRGLNHSTRALRGLTRALTEIFYVCKYQVHVFSGMRAEEGRHLPYHCMVSEVGLHGRKHCLVAGATTKFNKGRLLRTKWVTTERDGFRAIRLAQEFAAVIYETLGMKPSKANNMRNNHPLFPSAEYLPWNAGRASQGAQVSTFDTSGHGASALLSRLCPLIAEEDIAELEEIDPFRAWREEPEFLIGQRWPLSTHQLRRSLAVYANASGLVRLASLRRQLQHITREMSLYYGRGSTFCKNFIEDDPKSYKKHIAVDWQNGVEEAEMLAFVRDVLHSKEPMFGGAGIYYERQRERGEVMSREEVAKQMKAGLLAYRDGPLGGCTRPGGCQTRKGLNLIDTVCATDGCKHLIGKHSKILQTIRLKRAAMTHITPGSITEVMEREDLEALEKVEREWCPREVPAASSTERERA